MLTIKDHTGAALLAVEPGRGSRRVYTLMKEDYVTVRFSLPSPLHLAVGAYADIPSFTGEGSDRYELAAPYSPTQNAKTGGWDYELQLDAHYIKWKNKIFKYIPQSGYANSETSWSLTATLATHMGVFLLNLAALGYTYRGTAYTFAIDSGAVADEAKAITYESESMLDALYKMAETFDCEVWVVDNEIRFGRREAGDPVDFTQDSNVETMTAESSRTDFATRLYAFGSDRNLPKDYRQAASPLTVNGVVQKRLMLPAGTPYIDASEGMATEQAIEAVAIFDDVYPRTLSPIDDVTIKQYDVEDDDGNPTGEKWDAYRFRIPGFTFSEDYILPDTDLQAVFHTGLLAGMTFNVKFNPTAQGSSHPDCQMYEIIRNEDYGRPLPDGTLRPCDGDKVTLTGWDTSKMASLGLIEAAELELKQRAEAEIEKLKIDPANYRCKMISAAMFDAGGVWHPHTVGSRVTLHNAGCFPTGQRQSRIIGYEYDLTRPFDSPVYVVGEAYGQSRTEKLEGKIEALTLAGQTYTGAGGSGVYVIRTNDSTPPSDTNVYSALRTKRDFLSRSSDDTALGVISFNKWVEFGQYSAGASGAFLGKTTAGTLGEMDYLKVRKKAQFETLEIAEVRYVGGKLVVSPGDGVEITAVEELTDGYRCYYKGAETDLDGNESRVSNKFRGGDQIYCKVTNAIGGQLINHYWWRLCTDTGDGWFVVDKLDCDRGSDAPLAGDKCAQLGNRTEADRQSAIILSTVEPGHSPLLALYGDIDNYTLEYKDHVSMGAGADGTPYINVYGKCFIGERNGSSYLKYTPADGVVIRAKIAAESTVGNIQLNQYITNAVMGDMADDGKLTPAEKRQILALLIEIRQEHADILQRAVPNGIDYAAYEEAYWALLGWLTGETRKQAYILLESGLMLLAEDGGIIILEQSGVLSDMSSTTRIDRAYYTRLLNDYFAERDALEMDKMYGDYTLTTIDGGLVTTGSIQLKGGDGTTKAGITGNSDDTEDDSDDIRIWAGETYENRAAAPFRVTQSGKLSATGAEIIGDMYARTLTLQGSDAFLWVTSSQHAYKTLGQVPFASCRTIEIWLYKTSDTLPIITFEAESDDVWIARNFTSLPTWDEIANDPDLLEELSSVTVQDTGLYKAFGANTGSRTVWNIIKYEDSYVRGRTE